MICSGKISTVNRMANYKLAANSICLLYLIMACDYVGTQYSTILARERKQIESTCQLSSLSVLPRMSALADVLSLLWPVLRPNIFSVRQLRWLPVGARQEVKPSEPVPYLRT